IREVVEVPIRPGSALAGQALADVAFRRGVLVLAHNTGDAGMRFFHAVDPEARLVPGDCLVVCGEPGRLSTLLAQVENEALPELLWAGRLRRLGRVLWRTLAEVDWSVKICTAVLITVILVSTIVFHLTLARDGPADALYRTISL